MTVDGTLTVQPSAASPACEAKPLQAISASLSLAISYLLLILAGAHDKRIVSWKPSHVVIQSLGTIKTVWLVGIGSYMVI